VRVSFNWKLFLVLAAILFAQAANAERVVLVFGDSLSAGYGLPSGKGWVDLLAQRLEQAKPPYRVVNASISGETTLGGRNRIDQALSTHRPAIVIVELGANDGLRGQPIDAMRDNLSSIIAACRRSGAAVLLVGMRLPPNYGTDYTQKFQELFAGLAERNRLRLVPFMMEGFAGQHEFFQADGIHPTIQAQPLILENVWGELGPLLGNLRKGPS
jgi:acyl-CoA thioesterase I